MQSPVLIVDKMRLLSDKSTQNVSIEALHSNIAERQKRRHELLAELGSMDGEEVYSIVVYQKPYSFRCCKYCIFNNPDLLL